MTSRAVHRNYDTFQVAQIPESIAMCLVAAPEASNIHSNVFMTHPALPFKYIKSALLYPRKIY